MHWPSIFSVLGATQRPAMSTPLSLQSLQPVRHQQVMVPDARGILRPKHVRVETVQHINSLIEADEMMDATSNVQAFGPLQSPMMPFQPIAQAPLSTAPSSSFMSSTSIHGLQQGSVNPGSQRYIIKMLVITTHVSCHNYFLNFQELSWNWEYLQWHKAFTLGLKLLCNLQTDLRLCFNTNQGEWEMADQGSDHKTSLPPVRTIGTRPVRILLKSSIVHVTFYISMSKLMITFSFQGFCQYSSGSVPDDVFCQNSSRYSIHPDADTTSSLSDGSNANLVIGWRR